MRRVISLIVLVLAPPLVGCAAQAAGSSNQLAGSEWRFVVIDGEAPVSGKTRLQFAGERVSASVGCNAMAGQWRIESGRLIAGPLAQTRMLCDGRLAEQEHAVGALLVAAPELAMTQDRLELRSGAHHARLERIADPQG